MRIAFLDSIAWDYTVSTPLSRPLGGSQSATCYLAAALAALGHEVYLINGCTEPVFEQGVQCVPLVHVQGPPLGQLSLDVVFVLNSAFNGVAVRQAIGPDVRLVLWTMHDCDQAAVMPLVEAPRRDAFDAIACVSEWQKAEYLRTFGVDADRTWVLRNAISPVFEGLFEDQESILAAKRRPPVLAYTSTPFRGLDRLVAAVPLLQARHPGLELEIYSDLKVYCIDEASDQAEFGELYRQLAALDGTTHPGYHASA